MSEEPRGWYSRGYLPHIDAGSAPQFVTWRLKDSLPQTVLEGLRTELSKLPQSERRKQMVARTEALLDSGLGSCILRNPVAAGIVQDSILFGHEKKYQLHAWCVMPNHAHVLFTPFDGFTLASIMRAMKSFSAHSIHQALGGEGALWQEDFFDRLIRNETHFEKVLKYIEWNPVKAKLCDDPAYWPYSSARYSSGEKLVDSRKT